jgi:DNA replication and repair protein RecF
VRAKILFLIKNEEIRIKSFWFLTNFCGIPPDYVSKNAYLCIMILEKLSLINYKNIVSATLDLSPKINCLIGKNGVGKTNVLDAIYFLSFCHSASNPIDSQVIRHGQDFFVIEGDYLNDDWHKESDHSPILQIYCSMKRGTKKHFKRNKKEYKRLSEHIGLIPAVFVSPSDTLLIEGGSEERRRLMDMVISQYDHGYIEAMNRYNKALQQRNAMLKMEEEPDPEILGLWEEQMAVEGEAVFQCRDTFVRALTPVFQRYYETISGNHEQVSLKYISHCQRGPLLEVIRRDRSKDRIMGFSLHGIHRDDLEFTLGGHPMKREGSQGQHKTFAISLKLAQFDFLRRTNSHTTPLLLLDDIFDKLDAERVEQIVKLVAGDDFGQIFITDTNREHLDQILSRSSHDYKIFHVADGEIEMKNGHV